MNDLVAICRRPISELLPHRAPMILINEACGMAGDDFLAKVRITSSSPFFSDVGVPAWVGLEYMAQTVAAYSGAQGLADGGEITVGMLLGTRDYRAMVPCFSDGQELTIRARIELIQDNGVSSMHCRIQDAEGLLLAQADITVINVPDLRGFLVESDGNGI